jgi:hypothetical protein
MELGGDGFKEGEWFCSNFVNNGKAADNACQELDRIRHLLDNKVLYRLQKMGTELRERRLC